MCLNELLGVEAESVLWVSLPVPASVQGDEAQGGGRRGLHQGPQARKDIGKIETKDGIIFPFIIQDIVTLCDTLGKNCHNIQRI